VIAALASGNGNDVTVTAREEQRDAILANGLHLTGGWGERLTAVAAVETLTEKPELAFVAVKAQDTEAAIAENAEHLAGVPVVVVQNGLDGPDRVADLLPSSEVIGGLAMFAASYLTPGEVAVTTPGGLYLGLGSGAAPALAGRIAPIITPMAAVAVTNFTGAQWTKLVINHVNAMPAITGLSVQETIAEPTLRRLITVSMREAVAVARAEHVRFASMQGLTDLRLRVVTALPVSMMERLPQTMAKRMGATPNPGSTLQSIRRGQRTEIDYLNGTVVQRAARAGIDVPVSTFIVELVHEVEATGHFLTTPEVVRRAETAGLLG